jgi:hypothetical protein
MAVQQPHPPRPRSWAPLIVVTVIALVVAAAVAIGVSLTRSGGGTMMSSGSPAYAASLESACERWVGVGDDAPDDRWCRDMVSWMRDGHGMFGMMRNSWRLRWDDPDELVGACRAWSDDSAGDRGPARWCDDMVEWMRGHMRAGPHGWMMRGLR